eukprot:gene3291-6519_t
MRRFGIQRLRGLLYAAPVFTASAFSIACRKSFCSSQAKSPESISITVYQYKICPYCNRLKAFLDFTGTPYTSVEVNPLTKSEIKFSIEHKKVPIANVNGDIIADSGLIIEKVRQFLSSNQKNDFSSLYTPNSEQWILWSEKKLAVMLYPNITRNFEEAWECFEYVNSISTWNALERYANRTLGPVAMFMANGKIKKKYGIVNEREELRGVLKEWINALDNKPFLNGNSPTMPDIMVYGVINSVDGFKTFDFIMEDEILKLWYLRMKNLIIKKM